MIPLIQQMFAPQPAVVAVAEPVNTDFGKVFMAEGAAVPDVKDLAEDIEISVENMVDAGALTVFLSPTEALANAVPMVIENAETGVDVVVADTALSDVSPTVESLPVDSLTNILGAKVAEILPNQGGIQDIAAQHSADSPVETAQVSAPDMAKLLADVGTEIPTNDQGLAQINQVQTIDLGPVSVPSPRAAMVDILSDQPVIAESDPDVQIDPDNRPHAATPPSMAEALFKTQISAMPSGDVTVDPAPQTLPADATARNIVTTVVAAQTVADAPLTVDQPAILGPIGSVIVQQLRTQGGPTPVATKIESENKADDMDGQGVADPTMLTSLVPSGIGTTDLSAQEANFAVRIDGVSGQPANVPSQSAPPATPTVSHPVHPSPAHLAAQLLPMAQSAQSGPVEVLLNPAELGHLRFEIHQKGEHVQVVMTAERPETLDLLRRSSDQLTAEFRNAGFSGASLSFGHWGRNPEGQAPASFLAQTEDDFIPLAFAPIQKSAPAYDPSRSLNLRL